MSIIKVPVCLFMRVSTNKQDYERQLYELTEYCKLQNYEVRKVIASTVSGKKIKGERADLDLLFSTASTRQFKKVIVLEISRLGRTAKDVRNTISFLHDHKIPVVFKQLAGLESLDANGNETFVTNVIISIYSELAQEEHKRMRANIISGLNNAKAKGKILGRPEGAKSEKELIKKYSKLVIDLKSGLSLNKCCKVHRVSKNTVIKIKKIINNQ